MKKQKRFMMTIFSDRDRPVECVEIETFPSLEILQEKVGGNIELVPYWDGIVSTIYGDFAAVAFCNEEGKLEGLPYNGTATALWRMTVEYHHNATVDDVLVGDVVVVFGDKEFIERG